MHAHPQFAGAALSLVLLLAGCGGGGGSTNGSLSTSASDSASNPVEVKSSLNPAVVGHIDRLNEIRAQLGLGLLRVNNSLTQAAQAHADYLTLNQASGHEEQVGLPGFTGESIADRIKAAGYLGRLVQETKAGGASLTTEQGRNRMDALLLAPLHRLQLLAFEFDEIGVGAAVGGGALVTNLGAATSKLALTNRSLMVPFDGQTGIATSFVPGSEEGLPPGLPAVTGTPLTLNASMFATVAYSKVSLVDEATGIEVPLIALTKAGATCASLTFLPTQPLRSNARYTWQITATVDGVTTASRARFTTGT